MLSSSIPTVIQVLDNAHGYPVSLLYLFYCHLFYFILFSIKVRDITAWMREISPMGITIGNAVKESVKKYDF